MENIPNRKLKKIKRPIKRPLNTPENVAVPSKVVSSDNPFNRTNTISAENFDLNAYMEDDNLPAMQDEPLQNRINPLFLTDEDIEEVPHTLRDRFMVGGLFTNLAIISTALVCLILGIFIAKTFMEAPTTIQNGLQGVVINPEVPRGRARCGVAEKTQGCVLYVVNPQRQDLSGRDFYDLAAQLTGRQRFMIETSNMRYAGVKIKPGEFAQINIPPLQ